MKNFVPGMKKKQIQQGSTEQGEWQTRRRVKAKTVSLIYPSNSKRPKKTKPSAGNGVSGKARMPTEELQEGAGEALYSMGILHLEGGDGVAKDESEAFKCFKKALGKGCIKAKGEMEKLCEFFFLPIQASDHQSQLSAPQVQSLAFLIEAAMDCKLAKAQLLLGTCYESGLGVPEDLEKAFELYLKAAIQGDVVAQLNLAECYDEGIGVAQDASRAMEWLWKVLEVGEYFDDDALESISESAAAGNVEKQFFLGELYRKGCGHLLKDAKKAYKWLKMALTGGHKNAQERIEDLCESLYDNIEKQTPSAVAALSLLTDWEAKDCCSAAQNNLGACYENGLGVDIDEGRAFELYSKAAQQGLRWAQWNLAECYENGVGVAKNSAMARVWLLHAAGSGDESAQEKLDAMNASYTKPVVFTWVIKKASQLSSDQVYSTVFPAFGSNWIASFWPHGNEPKSKHASLFLYLARPDSLPTDFHTPPTHITLSLVNQKSRKLSRQFERYDTFSKAINGWGFPNHTPLAMVYDSGAGFLVKDTLVVEVTIRAQVGQ